MNFSTESVDAKAAAWGALLDGGFADIYTGTKPATANAAPSGTKLGRLTFAVTAFGAPSEGVIVANAISDDTDADASGTAGWFRLLQSDETPVADGDVGAEMALDSVVVLINGVIHCASFSYTEPK